jgi:hypothetical protein
MEAIFKFPALAKPLQDRDDNICPCFRIRNAYDGTARIAVHIGAFRFVCTNLAVGGGGVFAGGFLSIHAGEVPIEKMADRLADYLTRFEEIVQLYRVWQNQRTSRHDLEPVLQGVLAGRFAKLQTELLDAAPMTVFDAYNIMTGHATHHMRSARTAFDLLDRINTHFQAAYPLKPAPALVRN